MCVKIRSEGTVMQLKGRLGYFAWPSVSKLPDGTFMTVASGYRMRHICPFGRVVASYSSDGKLWTPPGVILDTGLDNRDAGLLVLQSGKTIVSTFTSHRETLRRAVPFFECSDEEKRLVKSYIESIDEHVYRRYEGGLLAFSDDGVQFSEPVCVGLSAPHGPIQLKDGRILYVGTKARGNTDEEGIFYSFSEDEGATWSDLKQISLPDANGLSFYEPTAVETGDGRILVQLRVQSRETSPEGISLRPLTVYQCESSDGGQTFTVPKPLGVIGSPPHLCRHSSGALIMTYGRRELPCGIRGRLSFDCGRSWGEEFRLSQDAKYFDLGYPCTCETEDGKLLTVYYQAMEKGENAAIKFVVWDFEKMKF